MSDSSAAIVRTAIKRLQQDVTARLAAAQFVASTWWFWVRPRNNTVEFIHVHHDRISRAMGDTAVSLRLHSGVRVNTDEAAHLHLNGPTSETDSLSPRLHLRFDASTESTYTAVSTTSDGSLPRLPYRGSQARPRCRPPSAQQRQRAV